MTSSNGNIFRVTGHLWIHRSPVNSPHKGHRRRALMFSLICAWINGWVNNREAGDLRRYRAHNDVTVMNISIAKSRAYSMILQWHYNERNGVSNHRRPNRTLSRRSWKKTSNLRVTGLCKGNSPVTGEFPAQRVSNGENVFIWWRHHGAVLYIQRL